MNLGNLVRGNLVRAKILLRVSIIVKKNDNVNCITGVFSNTLLHATYIREFLTEFIHNESHKYTLFMKIVLANRINNLINELFS